MKIVYCIPSLCNPGGMERVLSNKINYLVSNYNYDIIIITTNQRGRNNYFYLDKRVKCIDLKINFDLIEKSKNTTYIINYIKSIKKYKKALEIILEKEKPHILVSLFATEIYFIHKIKNNCKKVVEFHFSRYTWNPKHKKNIWKIIRIVQNLLFSYILNKVDSFIVLTDEDKKAWSKKLSNITVIPNSISEYSGELSDLDNKQIIAVGRLTNQKGFDILIDVWRDVCRVNSEWKLNIFGEGEMKDFLLSKIQEYNLDHLTNIYNPTKDIYKEYQKSSVFILSSRYEGFGMVLLEAMSVGLPVVSFACPCGPRDIINHEVDGYLIEHFSREDMVKYILALMDDYDLRRRIGTKAKERSLEFNHDKIITKWNSLFKSLFAKNS